MKKSLYLSVFFVVVTLFSGCTFFGQPVPQPAPKAPEPVEQEGITVELPSSGENIQSPLRITGSVQGDGWIAFEAQTGTVELLDGDGQRLAFGILVATIEDWMTSPVPFETTLVFDPPASREGELVFRNENPSGLEEAEREFRAPVTFGTVSEKLSVEVFFGSSTAGVAGECENVLPVRREIVQTSGVGRAALEELFKGPSEQEREQGFLTSINSGVRIQSLAISEGVARADFSRELEQNVGGSCRVAAIRAQIEETLQQFPTVDEVIISIDGRTEDILQP